LVVKANSREAARQIGVALQRGVFVIIQAGAAQAFIVQLVTQRLDQVQVAAGIGAEPDNVAGIGRYFRLEQDHVKHAQHRG
jgi:hypothetical protein